MLNELAVGDEVVTAGGIYGEIVGLGEEDVTVRIAPDARRPRRPPRDRGRDSRRVGARRARGARRSPSAPSRLRAPEAPGYPFRHS